MPSGWQRGLLWIPTLYLAFIAIFAYSQSLSAEVEVWKRDFDLVFKEQEEAIDRKDAAAAQRLDDEIERIRDQAASLQTRSLALAGGTFVAILIFAWATWQVTQVPWSGWETAARWAILLAPVQTLLVMAGLKSPQLAFVSKVAQFAISLGHERALEKICRWSGNDDLGERIGKLYGWFYRFVLIIVILAATGGLRPLPPAMRDHLVTIVFAVGGLFVLALSMTLWTLRTRLIRDTAESDTEESDDRYDDE